ncbi:hypothetical protein CbuK_1951 [Coxiella burnetii CbuK_Q154]|nr:hypothetical protein CbuK_1951 [Coxiella burnetii CbuK_Q154]APQ67127.1 hypothetical protein A35_09920 [Coxiella burnetii 'MSU Goat Q177']ATN86645.1 hypothetical protein AYO29_09640 [Coxiella burnetii str. Schperling]EDR36525.1 putative lipoprotein [Coxiella burnetii Q321]
MFELRFSRYFLFVSLIINLGGLSCVWMTALYLGIKFILTLLVIIHFFFLLRKYFWLSAPNSISAFRFDGEHWHLKTKNGKTDVTELKETLKSRYLILLNFASIFDGNRYQLILFPRLYF